MSKIYRDSQWDKKGVLDEMLSPIALPKMAGVKQVFDDTCIKDIPAAVRKEFDRAEIAETIKPGASIALTAGSRGIANIALITKEIAANVKRLGGKPFVVPAMGSHGGATAEGQREMIESFGITEDYIEAPIRSSMETTYIGDNADGKPVRIDSYAAAADGIIVAGRVKPHTAFRGNYESGLYKMMTIGLGKQKGAEICHAEGFGNMAHNVVAFAEIIMEKAPVLFGLSIIENAYDETVFIEAVQKEEIRKKEPELLNKARALMPKIHFEDIDIMIIDRIGKNFSGDGMDPNITGAFSTPYADGGADAKRYVVLDLSDETHGNAMGAGMADFSTKRLFDKIDFDAAYPNAITCTVVKGAKIPVILRSDKLALQAAIYTSVGINKEHPRIVRIPNSSHIQHIEISEALKEEAEAHPHLEIEGDFTEMPFDADGNLNLDEAWNER